MKAINFKRSIFAIFMIAVILLSAIPIGVSALESDIIYNDETGIPDPVLYGRLLEKYDENKDGFLQKEEALKVKLIYYNCLELDDPKPIYSLKGLNKCSNLSELIILYNKLTTLEGIEGLNLKLIRVHTNNLTDISAISGMSDTLETLNVQNNQLSKLPDLTNFSKLEVRTDTIVQATTDFEQNKLTRKEFTSKLPKQLYKWIDVWMSGDKQNPDPENMNLVDTDTGIEVTGLMHPEANLKIENVTNTVQNAVSTFDITLVINGLDMSLIKYCTIIQPDGEITISIPSEYSDCDIFWIKDDGTKVNMNAEYIDGKYIFTTDHLSVYALVRKSATLLGDVNGDGKVGIDDATNIQKYMAEMLDFTDKQKELADVNKDGKVGVDDVTLIQKHMAGLAVIE